MMRRLIIYLNALLFLAFSVVLCNPHSARAWQWNNYEITGEVLRSVCFASNATGYVVGDAGTILKTADGGSSWTFQNSGTTKGLYGVHFPVDQSTGYSVGSSGIILKTSDGGETWAVQDPGVILSFKSVHFIDNNKGWIAGEGVMLRTVNGGAEWSFQVDWTNFAGLESVFFIDENTGYAAGSNGKILKTVNGGVNWSVQTIPGSPYLYSIFFIDANTGWAAGASGTILKTLDGGTTWTSQSSGTVKQLSGIRMINAAVGYAAGGQIVLKTSDGGASWTVLSETPFANAAHFPVSESVGYLAGGSGSLYKTEDGGQTWTNLNQAKGGGSSHNSVHFPVGPDTGYITGNWGYYYKTTDGGATWASNHLSNGNKAFNFVHFPVDNSTGYMADSSVWKTTDGGANWTVESVYSSIGVNATLYAIHFPIDALTGYVVGNSCTIIKTTDGGSNWIKQKYDPANCTQGAAEETYYGVHFPIDRNTGYVVGKHYQNPTTTPKILKTTDGGGTWNYLDTTNITGSLSAVYFIDNSTGYVAGSTGVFKTSDGGDNWTQKLAGISFYSIHFPIDGLIGYAVGASGVIKKTVDGGDNWTMETSYASRSLSAVYFPSDTLTGYAIGSYTILKNGDGSLDNTAPADIVTLNDGDAADADSTSSTTILSANWTASSDAQSGIRRYWYAIGTTQGGTQVTSALANNYSGWFPNGKGLSLSRTDLSLTNGSTYYISVKAENGAELYSQVITSDGITVSDNEAPTVASTSPSNGAADIAINKVITATLSENMDAATISTDTFKLDNGAVAGMVSYNASTRTASFTPSANLTHNTLYTAKITTGVKDGNNNAMASDYTWTFTITNDAAPPTIDSVDPQDGASNIAVYTNNIYAAFSEAMDPSTITASTFQINNGSLAGTVSYNSYSRNALFSLSENLSYSTTYTAKVTTGVKDMKGNALASDYTWSFTTGPVPTYTFAVNNTGLGSGSGTVTSSPAGINCGSDCSEVYNEGTVVTLTAAPAPNSTFSGWQVFGCAGTGTCDVTITFNTSVDVNFDLLACASYTLSSNSQSFNAGGGNGGITVTALPENCASGWSATSNAGWITVTSGGNGTGTGSTNYSVTANTGPARSGTITIAGQTFIVNQASGCTYTVSPESSSPSAGAASASVSVTTADGCAWTAASNAGWITVTSGDGSGNGTVTYSITQNPNSASRTGTITAAGQTFTVTQSGSACTYSLNVASKSFDLSGGSDSVNVTATPSDCAWTATSNAAWLTISAGSSGTGNGTVTYLASANAGSGSRSGAITIEGQTFTVTQSGVTCSQTLDPASKAFSVSGGSDSIAVTSAASDCAWAAVSNEPWITVSSGKNGTGNGTINYAIASNTSASARNGSITAGAQTFTVTQAGASCTYTISPTGKSLTSSGGSDSITVTSSASDCAWTAASNENWISITAGSNGTGSGTVSYTVPENSGPSLRNGTITIADKTYSITQDGITITPQFTLTVSRAGDGTGSVTSSLAGIDCGTDCSEAYNSGTSLVLTAVADSSSAFTGWTGCESISGSTCTVSITSDTAITASFSTVLANQYVLAIDKTGNGSGTVKSSDGEIDCGSDCDETGAVYDTGKQVTLTATVATSSTFGSWTGDACNGSKALTCKVTMNSDKNISVSFKSNPIVTVFKSGNGDGTLTSSPKGISCGLDCADQEYTFKKGQTILLKAKPDTGSKFIGWSGDVCNGSKSQTCKISKISDDKEVTAQFGQPDMSLSDDAIIFDDTLKAQTTSKTVTITNNGDAPLTLKSIKVISGTNGSIKDVKMFKVYSGLNGKLITKATIPAGGELALIVKFKPTTTGQKTAKVKIMSDDPDSPSAEIQLSGTGTSANPPASPFSKVGHKLSPTLTKGGKGGFEDLVTREEAAEIIVRKIELYETGPQDMEPYLALSSESYELPCDEASPFIDVVPDNPYCQYIKILYDLGMPTCELEAIGSLNNIYFCPQDLLTIGQAAEICTVISAMVHEGAIQDSNIDNCLTSTESGMYSDEPISREELNNLLERLMKTNDDN